MWLVPCMSTTNQQHNYSFNNHQKPWLAGVFLYQSPGYNIWPIDSHSIKEISWQKAP